MGLVAVGLVSVAALALTGCNAIVGEDPDDVAALSMTQAQAQAIVEQNFSAVAGPDDHGYNSPSGGVVALGCVGSSLAHALPSGPPWWYRATRTYPNPADADLTRWRARAEALKAKGFHVVNGVDYRHEVALRDDRGFGVSLSLVAAIGTSPAGAQISSTSPCVRDADG